VFRRCCFATFAACFPSAVLVRFGMFAIVRFDAAAFWALPTFCRAAFVCLAVAIVASGL
jgi:hypothetical protein